MRLKQRPLGQSVHKLKFSVYNRVLYTPASPSGNRAISPLVTALAHIWKFSTLHWC